MGLGAPPWAAHRSRRCTEPRPACESQHRPLGRAPRSASQVRPPPPAGTLGPQRWPFAQALTIRLGKEGGEPAVNGWQRKVPVNRGQSREGGNQMDVLLDLTLGDSPPWLSGASPGRDQNPERLRGELPKRLLVQGLAAPRFCRLLLCAVSGSRGRASAEVACGSSPVGVAAPAAPQLPACPSPSVPAGDCAEGQRPLG